MKNTAPFLLAILFALTLFATGCSDSSGQTFAANGGPLQNGDRIGTLHLGTIGGPSGLEVRGFDAAGRLIDTTTTDQVGTFVLRNFPSNGRVVVSMPNVALSAEVDGRSFFWVTGVSTLVSRYLQANPGTTVAQAEEQIRRFLDIPAATSLQGTFGQSWRSAFSWPAFVRRAGDTPLDQFLDQQVAAASQGQLDSFREPHPYPTLYTALGNKLHVGNFPNGVTRFGQVRAQDGEVAAKFLSTLVDNVTADVIANEATNGLDKAFGWLGSLLGLNKDVEIAELQNAIKQLLKDVENISIQVQTEIEQEEFDAINNALDPALVRIGQQSLNYLSLADLSPSYPPDVPVVSIDPTVTAFATGLRAYADDPTASLQDDLALLRKYLQGKGGTQNPILLYASLVQNKNGNISPGGSTLFQDFRTNEIQEQVSKVLDYYRAYQILGANLLAENSHMDSSTLGLSNTQGTNTISSGIQSASTQIGLVVEDLMIEGQLVPPPSLFSDDVLADRHSGLMWSLAFLSAEMTVQAGSYQVAGSDMWSWYTPTPDQLSTLRGYALNAGGQNVATGLQNMGFTSVPTDGDIYVACAWNGPYTGYQDNKDDWHVYNLTTGQESTYEDFNQIPTSFTLLVRNCAGYTTTTSGSPFYFLTGYQPENLGNLEAVQPISLAYDASVPGFLRGTWSYSVDVGYFSQLNDLDSDIQEMTFQAETTAGPTLPPSWSVTTNVPPGSVSISSLPGEGGELTYLKPNQAFTQNNQGVASVVIGANGNPQGSTTLSTIVTSLVPFYQLAPLQPQASFTAPAPQLKSILVTPTNRVFEANLAPNGSLNVNFFATGFYDNGTVEDLTFKATWSVASGQSNGSGVAVFNPNGFASTVNQLRMPASLKGTELTITASFQDPNTPGQVSGSADVETDF
jgi:hypothetical protein